MIDGHEDLLLHREYALAYTQPQSSPTKKYVSEISSTTLLCNTLLSNLLYIYMYTLNINQSNVSTKLKKHDFDIPEIEVTSQLIDLRSSATLC